MRLVSVGTKLVALLLAVVPPFVYVGAGEPYIAPPPMLFGAADPLIFISIAFLLLVFVQPSKFLRVRYWRDTAREAGLTPVADRPDTVEFTGTVRGREVRAKIGTNSVFGSGANGFFKSEGADTRYTLVEVALAEPATAGVVIGPEEQRFRVTPYDVARFAEVSVDGLVAIGSREGLADAVLTSDVREAVLAVADPNQFYVGNARAAGENLSDADRTPRGTMPKLTNEVDAAHDDETGRGHWLGGTGWVTHITSGTVLDAAELQAQIDAVVAVAEAFEAAAQDDDIS